MSTKRVRRLDLDIVINAPVQEVFDAFTAWTQPGNLVSNGPFRLKSWRVNHHVELERNPSRTPT